MKEYIFMVFLYNFLSVPSQVLTPLWSLQINFVVQASLCVLLIMILLVLRQDMVSQGSLANPQQADSIFTVEDPHLAAKPSQHQDHEALDDAAHAHYH